MTFRTKLRNYFLSRDRGLILSLLAAVFLLYMPFLANPFVFDDLLFIFGGVAEKYAQTGFHLQLRWLPYASLGWTEMLFSSVVTHFFHLGNLLLHAVNVVLIFYLLRQLSSSVMADTKNETAILWGPWLGALIFALHPVAVYATGYVVERSILMATCFSLITQISYIRGLLGGQARWLALAVITYFLAVFSKEHSVMTLALLAAETILLRNNVKVEKAKLWGAWVAFVAVALLVIFVIKSIIGTPYEPMASALFEQQGVVESTPILHLLSIFTQAGLFFKYELLWLLPNPMWMSIDMREPFTSSVYDWYGWLAVTAYLAYGLIAIRLLLRGRVSGLIGLALLYPWLQFMLEFSSIRVQEPFVLYRSYLWMPGLLLFIPVVLTKWPGRKSILAGGVLALLLLPLAANRLWVFADPYRLWNDAALLLPDERAAGADRIYFNLAQAASGKGKLDEAIINYQRSLAISPQYSPVHFELGWIYALKGKNQDAMEQFDMSIKYDPTFANAYYGKGLLLKMQNKNALAKENMVKSCELKNMTACMIVNGTVGH